MKIQKPIYIAVALMSTPIESAEMKDSAVMMVVDTNLKKVIRLIRDPSDGNMSFRRGHYISVYRIFQSANLMHYKLHRIGDDTYSDSSPIVMTRRFNGQVWEEEWFDAELGKQVGPAPQPEL